MTRTIDEYLKSTLAKNSGSRYFKAFIRSTAASTDTSIEIEVLEFKLSATELWVKAKYTLAADAAEQYFICLRRGVIGDVSPEAGHTDHYIDSGNFEISTVRMFFEKSNVYTGATVEFTADLFARRKVVLAADVTYQTLITNYCTAIGKVPTFKSPAGDFWAYQFEKTGTVLTIESGRQFLSLLRSKYFIFAADAGGTDDVLFYSAYDPPSNSNDEYSKTIDPTITKLNFPNLYTKYITLMYEDETGALVDYTPNGTYPYFDQASRYYIGYLHSTAKPPSLYRDEASQLRLVNQATNRIVPVAWISGSRNAAG